MHASDAANGGDHAPTPDMVSTRALAALTPALSYGKAFGEALSRQWTPEDPDGNIVCAIAENKLSVDLLHAKMVEVQASMPKSVLCYPKRFLSDPEFREAYAHMMMRTFMKGVKVLPDNLAVVSGAGAVLELLFWCLIHAGDGVLLPAPIYPAFPNDMQVRSGAHLRTFDLNETLDIGEQLDAQAAACAAEGHPVKVFLFCNPNNPQGFVYKRRTVSAILHWCLKNKVHLISDEIYALSVWGEGGEEFVSTEVVAAQEVAEGTLSTQQRELLPLLLHTVCGFSKDFCASGLRVGTLHSRNRSLIQAFDNLSYFHACAVPVTWTLTQVLKDDAFMDRFIAENNKRMRAAFQGLADGLDAAGIPYLRPSAAMFCWVDLRAGLLEKSWEGERELWQALVAGGVVITPGEACRAEEPGFFRICWAWCPPEALPHAAQRMAKLLNERKAQKAKTA